VIDLRGVRTRYLAAAALVLLAGTLHAAENKKMPAKAVLEGRVHVVEKGDTLTGIAARYGVTVLESEIIGLVPSAALTASAAWFLQMNDEFSDAQILETQLRQSR